MEPYIKYTLKHLRIRYFLFWLIPVILLILWETKILPTGVLAHKPQEAYWLEVGGILCVVVCLPLSFGMYGWGIKRLASMPTQPATLKQYLRLNTTRICLLEVAVVVNLICTYLTLGATGNLCVLICLIASLFCVPGGKKIYKELGMDSQQPYNEP